MKFKKLIALSLTAIVGLSLTACGSDKKAEDNGNKTKIVVGASPVPHAEILEEAKSILKDKGYDLEIKTFDDYVLPNTATEEGSLDANFFQHAPYLETFNKEQNTHLVAGAKIHIEPMGAYSKKIKDISELKDGATVSIPNDGSNGARALKLLEANGLIKLSDSEIPSVLDIKENPKNLEVIEMEAAQLPSTLEDVDLSIINTNFALDNNLNPLKDALFIEGSDSPYANILVTKEGNENTEWFKALEEALTSDKIKTFIEEKYNGSIVPAF